MVIMVVLNKLLNVIKSTLVSEFPLKVDITPYESCKNSHRNTDSCYIVSQITNRTRKPSQELLTSRYFPIHNEIHFVRIYTDTAIINDPPQDFHLRVQKPELG